MDLQASLTKFVNYSFFSLNKFGYSEAILICCLNVFLNDCFVYVAHIPNFKNRLSSLVKYKLIIHL